MRPQFEGNPDREWAAGEERVNKIVFIGRNLPRRLLEDRFAECLYADAAAVVEPV